jgi:hypothetical protein
MYLSTPKESSYLNKNKEINENSSANEDENFLESLKEILVVENVSLGVNVSVRK